MKKNILSLILIVGFALISKAQTRQSQAYIDYINQYKDLAIEEMQKWHIPASITLAQGIFESRAGMSELAVNGNNHFGIKCHGWTGPKQYHDDDAKGECFRVYETAKESYDDHSRFLAQQPRYSGLFNLSQTDYKGWANGLKACGYATSPTYATRLINIIELYQLYQYDKAKTYDHFIVKHVSEIKNKFKKKKQYKLHPISQFNDNYYLFARKGDTFESIGEEVGISGKKLARYNERDKYDTLNEGDIIFLKKKRKKAPDSFLGRPHIVKPGESMYLIAQKYGIRLKYLYKMNHLDPDYEIYPGAQLKVR